MDHLVVVHGIRDNDAWAQRVANTLQSSERTTYTYPFNYFSLIDFTNPFRRRAAAARMAEALDERFDGKIGPDDTVSFVGHSFGTYLIYNFVEQHRARYRFGSIALISSVLDTLVAPRLISKCRRFRNFAATDDWVLLLNNLLPFPTAGLAGRIGCSGYVASADAGDSFFASDHGGWFHARRDGESDNWFVTGALLDFFSGRAVVSEIERPRVDGWLATLLSVYKLILPTIVGLLIWLVASQIIRQFDLTKEEANRRLSEFLALQAETAFDAGEQEDGARLALLALGDANENRPVTDGAFRALVRGATMITPERTLAVSEESYVRPSENGDEFSEYAREAVSRFLERGSGILRSGNVAVIADAVASNVVGIGPEEVLLWINDEAFEYARLVGVSHGRFSEIARCPTIDYIWFAQRARQGAVGLGVHSAADHWLQFDTSLPECGYTDILETASPAYHVRQDLAWSPAIDLLAILGASGEWLLFDRKTWTSCRTNGGEPGYTAIAPTAWGWYIAIDELGKIWKIGTDCNKIGTPLADTDVATSVGKAQLSKDGERVLLSTDYDAFLAYNGGTLNTLSSDMALDYVSLSRDGQLIVVSADNGNSSLFDARDGAPVALIPGFLDETFFRSTSGNNVVPDVSLWGGRLVLHDWSETRIWTLADDRRPAFPGFYPLTFTKAGRVALSRQEIGRDEAFLYDPVTHHRLLSPFVGAESFFVDSNTEEITAIVDGRYYKGTFGSPDVTEIFPAEGFTKGEMPAWSSAQTVLQLKVVAGATAGKAFLLPKAGDLEVVIDPAAVKWDSISGQDAGEWKEMLRTNTEYPPTGQLLADGSLLIIVGGEALRVYNTGKVESWDRVGPYSAEGLLVRYVDVPNKFGGATAAVLTVARDNDPRNLIEMPKGTFDVFPTGDRMSLIAATAGVVYRLDSKTGAITGVAAVGETDDVTPASVSYDGTLIYDSNLGLMPILSPDVANLAARVSDQLSRLSEDS